MSGAKNIIRKQTIHFQYNGGADGFALQQEVSDWCNLNLIPEIEQQLEKFSSDDIYLSIDKLEISAEIDSKNWKQKIGDELIFELNQKLNSHNSAISNIKKMPDSKAVKLDALIIFYLKNGFLPWWGKTFLDEGFKAAFNKWVTEEKSAKQIQSIREELEYNVNQRQIERIVNQVTEKTFFQFVSRFYHENVEVIFQFQLFFETVILNKISQDEQKSITKPVYVFLLNSVLKNKGDIEIQSVLLFIYKELEKYRILPKIKDKPAEQRITTNPVIQIWRKMVLDELKKIENQNKTNSGTKPESIEKSVKLDTGEKVDEADNEVREGIYIDNAGAVIFAAFIPALFEKLGLAENEKIINPDLATSIIQYGVTGRLQMEEYELVLPKILCGLDIDFPIDTNIEFNEKQKSEVDSMLRSLISHWSVLGDTSVEGLRETFLNRSGKLSRVNDEWQLIVEQKAYDMLLERIPWSFSIIKFPWMDMLLKTEWI